MVNERKTLSVSASCSSSFPSLFSSSLLSIPPRCSFDSPNVRVYPCPHRPVARRGGLVAPRLQRRELPQQQRVRFAKGVAAAVAGAAAAAVGGVDVLLVPVEAIRLNDRGRVAGWDKRERRQRERSKSSWDGRKATTTKKVLTAVAASSSPPPPRLLFPLLLSASSHFL